MNSIELASLSELRFCQKLGRIMDTEKFRLFITLAENLSFHRSAELEHVSPSKLSRVIQGLEKELGATLFHRDNKHVELTPQGHRFLLFAREQLAQWSTLRDSFNSESDQLTGTISIYCSVTASYSFLFDILEKVRVSHPNIKIKVHTGDTADAVDRVNQGLEDLAIAAKPPVLPNSLSFKQFHTSPLMFYREKNNKEIDAELALQKTGSWSRVPLIVSERGLAREIFDEWIRREKISPNIFSQVSGNEAIVSMVSLGFGVGLIPKIVVENSPLANRVSAITNQPELPAFEVGACVQRRRLKSPLVKAVWELIN